MDYTEEHRVLPPLVLAWDDLPSGVRERWLEQVRDVAIPPILGPTNLSQLLAENVDPRELTRRISRDPLLASRILAVANSAAMGLIKRVTSLERAVVHLGTNLVQTIVVCYQLEMILKQWPNYPREHFNYVRAWSAGAAVLAQHFGAAAKCSEPYVLSTAALLTRLGTLLLGIAQPPPGLEYRQQPNEIARLELEWRSWGVHSAALSAQLAQHWGLPEPLPTLLKRHVEPLCVESEQGATERDLLVVCVAVVMTASYLTSEKADPRFVLDRVAYETLKTNLRQLGLRDVVLSTWAVPRVQRELAAATE